MIFLRKNPQTIKPSYTLTFLRLFHSHLGRCNLVTPFSPRFRPSLGPELHRLIFSLERLVGFFGQKPHLGEPRNTKSIYDNFC